MLNALSEESESDDDLPFQFDNDSDEEFFESRSGVRTSFAKPSQTLMDISAVDFDESAMRRLKRIVPILRPRVCKKLDIEGSEVASIARKLDPADLFAQLFLNGKLSEILLEVCNKGLRSRPKQPCTKAELFSAIGLVFASAFSQTSLTALTDPENADVYNIGQSDLQRLLDIIVSMDGKQDNIHGYYHTSTATYDRDINSVEEAFADTCSSLLYLEGLNDFSADDDLTRQRSRRLSRETGLKHVHVPNKAFGAQQTTLACPLTNLTFATRYAAKMETTEVTLKTLLRRVQGHADPSLVTFRHATTIFIDRGYVTKDVIDFLFSAGIHLVGTQKRGSNSPFTFGEKKGSDCVKHVAETGILTEMWATNTWPSKLKTYHLALRECSTTRGRVATLITTRHDLQQGRWSIKPRKPGCKEGKKWNAVTVILKEIETNTDLRNVGNTLMDSVEQGVRCLTEGQSRSDRLWFVDRGLRYTSTVGLLFLQLCGKKCPGLVTVDVDGLELFRLIGIDLVADAPVVPNLAVARIHTGCSTPSFQAAQ